MDRQGEIDLSHKEHIDHITRDIWIKAIALTFTTMQPRQILINIVASGFPMFLSLAKEGYAGQGLRDEDFRTIFDQLHRAAEHHAQVPIH